jgi:hypothetical protein
MSDPLEQRIKFLQEQTVRNLKRERAEQLVRTKARRQEARRNKRGHILCILGIHPSRCHQSGISYASFYFCNDCGKEFR